MSKKYFVGVWGQYGDGGVIADGQAVRTTIITKELEDRYGKENVLRVNTNNWIKRPFSFLFESIGLIAKSEKVVIFPADNGFKVFVPLLSFVNKFYKRKLLDVVIGGYLPAFLSAHKKYIKMLKRFDALFVQTPNLKKDLEAFGLTNIRYITNLKRLTPVEKEDIVLNTDKEIKLCLFSRITEDKGVADAVEAVKLTNKKLGFTAAKLDIYGIVGNGYNEKFDEILKDNADIISYKGVVNYNSTVDVLKNYFALLFPTYFHGEGFPGGFIDAFNSGIPVIATDWLYNKDLIEPGVNGLLVPIKNPEAMSEAILSLYNDREKVRELSLNNLNEAKKYTPDKVLEDFYSFID